MRYQEFYNKEDMNINQCINCSGSNFSFVYAAKDRFHKLPGKFEIVRCQECGIYYTNPQLPENAIEEYYPENYICFVPTIDEESNSLKRFDQLVAMSKRRKQIEKRIVGNVGKILDVGCATGIFLNEMKNHGWDCYGVEPNEKAALYAREKLDVPINNGTLDDSQFPDNYFDVITLWDVLEHVREPNVTLAECYRIIKPGGLIFLSLPNSNSVERHIFNQYWLGWDVPRHYRTYDNKNITEYLRKQNYQNIKVKSFFGHHGAFMLSFTFWLDECKLKASYKRFIFRAMNSLPVRIASLPLFLLLEKFNLSTIMGVSAQKPKNNP